jgi:DNA-binding NtrC family response regulator
MEILLVEKDPLVRDQVKVGLQQFPEFTVTVGEGYQGINELRQRQFDCVFLGVDPRDKETVRLLHHMRSFDKTTELVVLTMGRSVKDLSGEKAKFNIHSFLQTPLDIREFFGFLGRFLERRTDRDHGKIRKNAKGSSVGIRR